MKLDDLTRDIARLYAAQTDTGILMGMMIGRDACVSTSGPFEVELVGADEKPSFHAVTPYVRYHIDRSMVNTYGKLMP